MALLKKLTDQDRKLEELRHKSTRSHVIAFGSSTARMHTSMLDMSKRTLSQGSLSPPKHGAAGGAGVAGAHGGGAEASTRGAGSPLRSARRATSSLTLSRRSHPDQKATAGSLLSTALGMLVH